MPHEFIAKDEIEIDKIDVLDEVNVRHRNIYDGLEELAKSIEALGLQNPIVISPYGKGRYKLISGQRRLLAVRDILKRKTIRASVLTEPIGDIEARVLSLTENLARRNLDPKDIRIVCDYFYGKEGTIKKVAERLALSETTIRKYLSYNRLVTPSVKRIVEEEKRLTVDDAKKIAQFVPDEERQYRIAEKLKEIRERPAKERVFDALREAPQEKPEQIFERADRMKYRLKFEIEFPEKISLGLEAASKDLEKDVVSVIKEVITDWLESRGYV